MHIPSASQAVTNPRVVLGGKTGCQNAAWRSVLGEGAPGVRWVGVCSCPTPSDPAASSPPAFSTSFFFSNLPFSPKRIFPPPKKCVCVELHQPNLDEKVEPCWSRRAFFGSPSGCFSSSRSSGGVTLGIAEPDPGMSFPLPNFATALGAALGTTFAFYPRHSSFSPRAFPWNEKRSGHLPVSLCLFPTQGSFWRMPKDAGTGSGALPPAWLLLSSVPEPHPIPQTCPGTGLPFPPRSSGRLARG